MNVLIFLLSMSPSIKWSYLAPNGGCVAVSPAIADVDPASPGSEIIFATHQPTRNVYCLSSDGNLLWSLSAGGSVYSSPIIADLGATGDPAIIVVNEKERAYCLNSDGTLRWSFPGGTGLFACHSAIVANIDTIGPPEVIVSSDSYIYCLNNDATEKWKVSLPSMHSGNSPAVANIDEVGTPEILFSTRDSLYCINSDGTIRWVSHVSNGVWGGDGTSPSICDIDLDGDPEVVFGDWCFEADGTLRWHYGLSAHSTSAIADVDDNGFPDVVTYCQKGNAVNESLYVFTDNGTSVPTVVWRAEAIDESNTNGETPIICDIDGDGDRDVLWQGSSWLRIYDGATGAVLYENTELTTMTANEHGVAVADVDGDGKIEMVAIYKNKGVALVEDTSWVDCDKTRFSGLLYHITGIDPDLSVPKSEPFSWESHNTWLTQICEDPQGVEESEKLKTKKARLEVSPNPFVRFAEISYAIAGHLPMSRVSLKLYDTAGRCARTLVSEEKGPGYYKVNMDTEGLETGIYFVTLTHNGERLTDKAVLIK